VLHRQADLVHGFVSMIGLSVRCREAVAEAAGALRAGLAFAARGEPVTVLDVIAEPPTGIRAVG